MVTGFEGVSLTSQRDRSCTLSSPQCIGDRGRARAPVGVGGKGAEVGEGGPGRDQAAAIDRIHDGHGVAPHACIQRVPRVAARPRPRLRWRRVRRQCQHQVPVRLRTSGCLSTRLPSHWRHAGCMSRGNSASAGLPFKTNALTPETWQTT